VEGMEYPGLSTGSLKQPSLTKDHHPGAGQSAVLSISVGEHDRVEREVA
jgi:hypothetical protein